MTPIIPTTMNNTFPTVQTIIGIGVDIIEIDRFRSAMHKYGQRFLDKLFTKNEQQHCLRYKDPEPRFAARFSAKEAVVKALGEGFGKNISFLDIEILNHPNGKPSATLSDKCSKHFHHPIFHLSMSHSRDYATASAIALGNPSFQKENG